MQQNKNSTQHLKNIAKLGLAIFLLVISIALVIDLATPAHAKEFFPISFSSTPPTTPTPDQSTNTYITTINTFVTIFGVMLAFIAIAATLAAIVGIFELNRIRKMRVELDEQKERQREDFISTQNEIEKAVNATVFQTGDTLQSLQAFQKSFEESSRSTQHSVSELTKLARIIQDSTQTFRQFMTFSVAKASPTVESSMLQQTENIQKMKESDLDDKLMIYQHVSNEYTHIIATPLYSIQVAISNIQEHLEPFLRESGTTSSDAKILNSFIDNAIISLDSIKSILKHGAGFLPGEAERFSVPIIIRRAIRMANTSAPGRVEPSVSVENIPEVKYYPANLLIALVQLLNNAYEALHAGGNISVSCRYEMSNNKVSILIINDGDPISSETQSKMFELGYSTKADPGRGSGLFIARRCLEELNGQVNFVSSNTAPTTFEISFYPLEVY